MSRIKTEITIHQRSGYTLYIVELLGIDASSNSKLLDYFLIAYLIFHWIFLGKYWKKTKRFSEITWGRNVWRHFIIMMLLGTGSMFNLYIPVTSQTGIQRKVGNELLPKWMVSCLINWMSELSVIVLEFMEHFCNKSYFVSNIFKILR